LSGPAVSCIPRHAVSVHTWVSFLVSSEGPERPDRQDSCLAVEVDGIPAIRLSDGHEQYKRYSYVEAKEYLKWELIALVKLMRKLQG